MATKPSNPGQMSHFYNPRVARLLQAPSPVSPEGGDEDEGGYSPSQGTRSKERLPGYSRKAMRLAMRERQE